MQGPGARRALAITSLVFVMCVWGGSVTVTKAAVDQIPPILLAFLRFAIAASLLIPVAVARQRRADRPGAGLPVREIATLGFIGITLYYLGYNVGVDYATATQSGLIQAAGPAMTAVLAFFTLGERPRAAGVAGIALSAVGMVVILLSSEANASARNPLLGGALLVAATVVWSVYTIRVKRVAHVDSVVMTAYSAAAGALFLIPAVGVEYALGARPQVTVSGWLSAMYLGVMSSAVGYLLYNRALKSLSAGQVATFLNLIPVVTAITAVLFLGERLTTRMFVGGALVLFGVWLTSAGPAVGAASVPGDARSPATK
jgi:drug/metabolite transporter (DMT)-like permease